MFERKTKGCTMSIKILISRSLLNAALLRNQHLVRLMKPGRPICTSNVLWKSRQEDDAPKEKKLDEIYEFTPIYRFPHIVATTVLCRFKLYQTALTIGLVPAIGMLYTTGQASLFTCVYAGSASALACTVLYIVGQFFRRFVGVLYLDKTKENLKISHLTFFGNRRDIVVPVNDVIPFSDTSQNSRNLFYTLQLYSTGDKYFYIIKMGGVIKPEDFSLAVGVELPPNKEVKK